MLYISGKETRSQIYIKLTQSNDDSWKHPLKYFCLKCHIWWEINNLTSRLEFIAQWAFDSFLFWHRCNAKFVIGFSLFSRDPDGRSISNFYRFVSLCMVDYIKCVHCQQLFVSKNQFCNVPLISQTWGNLFDVNQKHLEVNPYSFMISVMGFLKYIMYYWFRGVHDGTYHSFLSHPKDRSNVKYLAQVDKFQDLDSNPPSDLSSEITSAWIQRSNM